MNRAWIDLDPTDVRTLLVSLIGYRFGERPEERIAEIRTERQDYARSFLNKEFRRVLKPGGKIVFDFADAHQLFSRFHRHGNGDLFREHAEYYREDPSALAGLVQWNSARAITLVAREAGFRRLHKRGQKLLFRHR